jgi:hypothetical protein
MRFCQAHWEALRAAIRERGLERFVARDGEDLAAKGRAAGFEPLIGAHNAIVQNAIGVAGLAILDGAESCPLCFLIAGCGCKTKGNQGPCDFTRWVDRAAADQLAEAKDRGLLG